MCSATRQRRWRHRTLAVATSALAAGAFLVAAQPQTGEAAPPAVPEVADQVPQLIESGVTGGPVSVSAQA
ncbi:hypothetical protein CFP71_41940, partial [Amycolatopsis thailandensis]